MKIARFIRSTWWVSALTFLSRLLGLARDKALVLFFGTSAVLDAFLLAFTIPNLFRRLFGEGALTAAVVPLHVESLEQDGGDHERHLTGVLTGVLSGVLTGIAALGVLLCLAVRSQCAEGSDARLTLGLVAAFLPFLVFICLAALLAAFLQGHRRFALPATMPVVLNLGFLGGMFYLHTAATGWEPGGQAVVLALIVVGTAALQVAILAGALLRQGALGRPRFAWQDAVLRRLCGALGPAAFGLAVFQLNVLADRLIAYLLVPGSGALTHLYLGNRLMQLPLGLFAVAVATTVFPDFVSELRAAAWPAFFRRWSTAQRFLLFVLLPATAGLIALAEPVVRMLFQEADLAFTDESVYRTARVLVLYAPGLVFIALQQLSVRIYHGLDDYRTPVRLSCWMVGGNLVLNLILIYAPDLYLRFAHGTVANLQESGLALSTTLCAAGGAFWLRRGLRPRLRVKKAVSCWDEAAAAVGGAIGRIGVAAALTGVFAYLVARSIQAEPEWAVRLERGLGSLLLGVAIYVVLCLVIPVPEFSEFVQRSAGAEKNGESP